MNLQRDYDKGQKLAIPSSPEGLELAAVLLSTQKQLVAWASVDKSTAGLSAENMRMAIQRYRRVFFQESLVDRLNLFIEKGASDEFHQQLQSEFSWLKYNLEFPFKTGGEETNIGSKTKRKSSPPSLEGWARELGQVCVVISELLIRSSLKNTQQPAGLEALSAPKSA